VVRELGSERRITALKHSDMLLSFNYIGEAFTLFELKSMVTPREAFQEVDEDIQ